MGCGRADVGEETGPGALTDSMSLAHSIATREPARLGPALDLLFFQRPADVVAPALVGTIMACRTGGVDRRARIVETEAYLGPRDLASHASKGLTPRTQVLYGPPARAYVYFIYGMHWMFNVVCGEAGGGQAVLIRGAEALAGWECDLSGPGRLARGFGINREHHGSDIATGGVHFLPDVEYQPRILRTRRIGVDYAGAWKNRLLRYVDTRSPVARHVKHCRKHRRA